MSKVSVKTAITHGSLKRNDFLVVNEIDGVTWATNRYWMHRVTVPLEKYLAGFNLGLEPAYYIVGTNCIKQDSPPPPLNSLLPRGDLVPVQPDLVGETSRVGAKVHGDWCYSFSIWLPSKHTLYFDALYVDYLEQSLPGAMFAGTADGKKLVLVGVDGEVEAALMERRVD